MRPNSQTLLTEWLKKLVPLFGVTWLVILMVYEDTKPAQVPSLRQLLIIALMQGTVLAFCLCIRNIWRTKLLHASPNRLHLPLQILDTARIYTIGFGVAAIGYYYFLLPPFEMLNPIPIYPHAKALYLTHNRAGFFKAYGTTDSFEQVYRWYEAQLPKMRGRLQLSPSKVSEWRDTNSLEKEYDVLLDGHPYSYLQISDKPDSYDFIGQGTYIKVPVDDAEYERAQAEGITTYW